MIEEQPMGDERRLGDRILYALELALEQRDLDTCDLLAKALEVTLTRFGGPGAVDKRDVPERMLAAFDALDRLRHSALGD
ncbi:MAG TPA: hypothetical protein VGE72_03330 [Azospirillum sp.]